MNPASDLTYCEVACLMSKAANIINERPLGVRHHGRGSPDLCVITPNLLLQGSRTCSATDHGNDFEKEMAELTLRLSYIEKSFEEWWQLWISSVWPSLVPYRKWKVTQRNIAVGDIVLVRYDKKYTKPGFRLARIVKVHPDDKGVVRTAVAGCRPRSKLDRGKKYIPKKLEELTVSVQRLVVILAVEEQNIKSKRRVLKTIFVLAGSLGRDFHWWDHFF